MNAHKYVRLRGFGLGRFEKSPVLDYESEEDGGWDTEKNCPVPPGTAELLADGPYVGFLKRFSSGECFALMRAGSTVQLACRTRQDSLVACLMASGEKTANARVRRGLFRGIFELTQESSFLLSYPYDVHRLAEFIADPLVKEQLDFFKYVSHQQVRKFQEFTSLFKAIE